MEGSVMKVENPAAVFSDLLCRQRGLQESGRQISCYVFSTIAVKCAVHPVLCRRLSSISDEKQKSVWGAGGIAYHNGIITGRELVV